MLKYDAIIIGAGAAGLMCALTAGHRKKKILLLERSKKPGAKILISGGGRCNFTNQGVVPTDYICRNPHFAKSALSRYTPSDIMDFLSRHGLTWHEKTLGQLFCDQRAGKVLDALLTDCEVAGVTLATGIDIQAVSYKGGFYSVKATEQNETKTTDGTPDEMPEQEWLARKLIVASGGVSIPKMGATDFGYRLARQFGLKVVEPLPALVPLTFDEALMERMRPLAGVSADSIVSCGAMSFRENLLFTHRGLSGPAILQISSYWRAGDPIEINLLPSITNCLEWLKTERTAHPKLSLKGLLRTVIAERLAEYIASDWPGNMADLSHKTLEQVSATLSKWTLLPTGTEGFQKAEVTKGGVNTDALSSKTMEVKSQPGLYFVGECVDVTGWLGGYNFQWAWASGYAAGVDV